MGTATEVTPLPSPATRDDDDERFVQVLEQYDDYLADQQHAIELLKQGFLKLTMAKMNLPAHAVGELSYKDEFEAALCVVEESDGTLSTIKASERDNADSATGEDATSSSTIKRRKDGPSGQPDSTADASNAKPSSSSSGAKEEDAAIMWFSSLPPPNLRLAQKHFRSALQALLVSTSKARAIQRTVESSSLVAPTHK